MASDITECIVEQDNYCVYSHAAVYATQVCHAMLHDHTFMAELRKHQFDLVIVDRFVAGSCMFLIPYILGVPYVGMGSVLFPWTGGSVALPSFVPTTLSDFSDNMSFYQRLVNTFVHIVLASESILPGDSNHTLLHEFAPEMTSWMDLIQRAELQFNTRNNLLEWGKPLVPNTIEIPGMTAKPAQSLSGDLENLFQKSTGIIMISFGSHGTIFPRFFVEMFFAALSQFEETVVWKLKNVDNIPVPGNVHILKWLPQNDMLGHPKTRLFITHCGNNGQYEAVYHGVPMLGFPLFGDQQHNCFRMAEHGIGIRMDTVHSKITDIVQNIRLLLGNSTHRQKILHKSKLMQKQISRMTHLETVSYWVEHILKYGSSHLTTSAAHMSWCHLLMLDVFTLIVALGLALCCTGVFLLKMVTYLVTSKSNMLWCS